MKKYFITGLVILLPLTLTIAIIMFMVNLFTAPFIGVVQSILSWFGLLNTGFLFLSAQEIQVVVSKIIVLVLLFFLTVALGILGRWFFFHYMISLWDYVLHRIPLVSSIYKACQEVIKTLFEPNTKSFKQVVLVPFPSLDTYSIGLVTGDPMTGLPHMKEEKVFSVFVPTTPNPTSGFIMLFAEKDIVFLEMKVEDALKYILSCGVVMSPIQSLAGKIPQEPPKI